MTIASFCDGWAVPGHMTHGERTRVKVNDLPVLTLCPDCLAQVYADRDATPKGPCIYHIRQVLTGGSDG